SAPCSNWRRSHAASSGQQPRASDHGSRARSLTTTMSYCVASRIERSTAIRGPEGDTNGWPSRETTVGRKRRTGSSGSPVSWLHVEATPPNTSCSPYRVPAVVSGRAGSATASGAGPEIRGTMAEMPASCRLRPSRGTRRIAYIAAPRNDDAERAMTTTTLERPSYDPAAAEDFAGRVGDILNAGATATMMAIGHRLGLFDALAGLPPA